VNAVLEQAADRLRTAAATGVPCEPVRDLLGTDDVDLAYAVQRLLVDERLYVDGELVSQGTGAACLGDPLQAVLWLARATREHGDPLRAGQVILSGALGPMVPATAGSTLRADVLPLGSVRAVFSEKDGS
jgi:2-keto-4-pentenoate hydratase